MIKHWALGGHRNEGCHTYAFTSTKQTEMRDDIAEALQGKVQEILYGNPDAEVIFLKDDNEPCKESNCVSVTCKIIIKPKKEVVSL